MEWTIEKILQLKPDHKVLSLLSVQEVVKQLRKSKKTRIVLAQGVFDVLHTGHIQYLRNAKKVAGADGILIVGIENNKSVKKNKGATRPVNTEMERMMMLSEMRSVDLVFSYEDEPEYNQVDRYIDRYKYINPTHLAVVSYDTYIKQKAIQCKTANVQLVIVDVISSNSTTKILRELGYEH